MAGTDDHGNDSSGAWKISTGVGELVLDSTRTAMAAIHFGSRLENGNLPRCNRPLLDHIHPGPPAPHGEGE